MRNGIDMNLRLKWIDTNDDDDNTKNNFENAHRSRDGLKLIFDERINRQKEGAAPKQFSERIYADKRRRTRPVFYGSRWLSSTAPNQNVITDPGAHNAHLSLRRRCSAFDGILASSTNLDFISFNFSCRITPSPTLVQLLSLCLAPLSTNWHFICMLYDD